MKCDTNGAIQDSTVLKAIDFIEQKLVGEQGLEPWTR